MFEGLVRDQCGVVSRWQARSNGVTDDRIRANVAAGRWSRLFPGVYATFSGPPTRPAQLWAAVLRAGADAMLSHYTAAELLGLLDRPSSMIHVTVPHRRSLYRIPGVRLHRSRNAGVARHPTRTPPQTRVEDTMIDLTQTARCLDDAISWLVRAVGARLTTPDRLGAVIHERQRLRWRRPLTAALADVAEGCHSMLELAYLRDVERAHGLPPGERQAPRRRTGGRSYDDVLYRLYHLRVELDGSQAHPARRRPHDRRGDNRAVLDGDQPLRYGPGDVYQTPCELAAEVGTVLQAAGWTGRPRRCRRPDCVIP